MHLLLSRMLLVCYFSMCQQRKINMARSTIVSIDLDIDASKEYDVSFKPKYSVHLPPFQAIGRSGINNMTQDKGMEINKILFDLSSNQNATWLFWLLILNRDIKTNIAVIEPSSLTEAEVGKLKRGYKVLETLNIVKRIKNKHYLVNPKAIIPLTKCYPDVVAHWFQLTGAQP